jgi:hypothetical protein
MIRRLASAFCMVVAALILAAGFTWWSLIYLPEAGAIANGPWRTSRVAGSADADMYTRAIVAVTGLFALNRDETIYFSARETGDHQALLRNCVYVIEGKALRAGWWSVTAYAQDNFLIPNAANRFSFNMGNLVLGPDGGFRIDTAPSPVSGQWLPTGEGNGGFSLLLRLYNPAPEVAADPGSIPLPTIRREGGCA